MTGKITADTLEARLKCKFKAHLKTAGEHGEPHDYDLCERHTSRLSVPNGWRLEDRRSRRVLAFAATSRLAG